MWRILRLSFYEAILAPLLYILACVFAVTSLCWPLLLILAIGSGECSTPATIILCVTQGMWWVMSFCLAVQLCVLRDSHRTDLSRATDYDSISTQD